MSPNETLILWLVRHGETVWNSAGLISGWSDVALTDRGEEMARALRPRLQDEVFDTIWSSDLVRAQTTATLAIGPAEPDERLRELFFGDLEGVVWDTLDPVPKEALLAFTGFQAPNGEHVDQLRERLLDFISDLDEGRHLLFVHAAVIRCLMREVGADEYVPPTTIVALDWTEKRLIFVERGPTS
jgi:probable phosphoglycerate mutase